MDKVFKEIEDLETKIETAKSIVREVYPNDNVLLDKSELSEAEWFNLKMIERYGRHWRRNQDAEED